MSNTFCLACGSVWYFDEIQWGRCDSCGWSAGEDPEDYMDNHPEIFGDDDVEDYGIQIIDDVSQMAYELTEEEKQSFEIHLRELQAIWEANKEYFLKFRNRDGIRSSQVMAIIAREIIDKRLENLSGFTKEIIEGMRKVYRDAEIKSKSE